MRSLRLDGEAHGDVTLSDFRHGIDFLLIYGKEEKLYPAGDNSRTGTSLGIRVSRAAGTHDPPLYRLESTRVPFDNLVFREPVAPVSALFEFPLQARTIYDDRVPPIRPLTHSPVAFLYCNVDAESAAFGSLIETFSSYGDDVLVVREDGEDLDPMSLAALCTFAKDQLSSRLAGVTFSNDLERAITLMSIARGNWEQYFENYRHTATPDGLIRGLYGVLE
ncbi:hypothetical protein EV356DRAFT_539743 [Viridothelium virens]|uniref:Uncharacterized protein n=1 Tax=Viridothelium virens TaxID=1048519 RepID=A0A6A6GTW3_VIRVR|nr:hypothetical protein EV356DRAFT_539743 [Viridothelium virens]